MQKADAVNSKPTGTTGTDAAVKPATGPTAAKPSTPAAATAQGAGTAAAAAGSGSRTAPVTAATRGGAKPPARGYSTLHYI